MLIRTVFQYYSSGKNTELMYDINHLQRTVLRGENLESFHSNWIMALREIKKAPYPTLLSIWTPDSYSTSGHWPKTSPIARG